LCNVLYKRVGPVPLAPMIAWLSLVAGLATLALSAAIEGPSAIGSAMISASWPSWLALAYLAFAATSVAWWLWGHLLSRHAASVVAPFALLVPVISAAVSYVAFGERFGPLRLGGMATILAGLAILMLPRHTGRRQHGQGET
ncbi:MAG TPA: EamA family transporter, partial [Vineibacter sp.]|nr:EamA family transporter [Vineibacter sp.]